MRDVGRRYERGAEVVVPGQGDVGGGACKCVRVHERIVSLRRVNRLRPEMNARQEKGESSSFTGENVPGSDEND